MPQYNQPIYVSSNSSQNLSQQQLTNAPIPNQNGLIYVSSNVATQSNLMMVGYASAPNMNTNEQGTIFSKFVQPKFPHPENVSFIFCSSKQIFMVKQMVQAVQVCHRKQFNHPRLLHLLSHLHHHLMLVNFFFQLISE